jgi:hypothetical protein
MAEIKNSMTTQEIKVINTKEDLLRDFVKTRYEEAATYWKPFQKNWREIKENYKQTTTVEESDFEANLSMPYLKKIIRNKVSHYMDILLSRGAESFDLEPGEEEDEQNSELLRHKIVYDLNNAEVEKKLRPYIWNYENYGYGVVAIPWRIEKEKQRTGTNKEKKPTYKDVVKFNGPDMDNVDVLTFLSDPHCKDLSSWKIFKKDNVPATYLRQKEKEKVYINIAELKDTSYPDDFENGVSNAAKDSVELLEYHGLVPQKLIEGKLNDSVDNLNPFEEDYVWAIITLANREKIIRAAAYPYWCGNIFVPAWKDKLTGENTGIGTGEDTKALIPMITNLHNKLTDIVNYIANNMYEFIPNQYLGNKKTIKSRPGKFFPVKRIGTIVPINTTAQAAALAPLRDIIDKLEKVLEELTATPPQVMPSGERTDVHSTYSGLMQMTEQAMKPIQDNVKNELEPAFKKILEIIYKHNIQFFDKEKAARILGKERAKQLNLTEITRTDITLKGNPDFIPTGVSGFMEKLNELKSLMTFLEILMKAYVPKKDPITGKELPPGPDGKPQMEPVGDIREVISRIADRFMFKDKEKLIPSLKIEREKQALIEEYRKKQEQNKKMPAEPASGSPSSGNMVSPVFPQGGQKQPAEGQV